jgi:hypothetical protein
VCIYIRDRYRAIVKRKAQSLNFPSIKNNIIKRGGKDFSRMCTQLAKLIFLTMRTFAVSSLE